MKIICLTLLIGLGMATHCFAKDWMKNVPDYVYLSQVSFPGTHDSATGNGVGLTSFSQCQDISVAEQWSIGIRAFDFRPRVKNGYLNINHGVAETKLRFDDALFLLRDSLKAHPSEFAVIHCLYATNYDKEKAEYARLLQQLLSRDDLKDVFIPFKSNLKVGDVRGKILLLSRNDYADAPYTGGFFNNWCGYIDWNAQTNGKIIGLSNDVDCSTPLYVQDFANTKDDDGGVQKKVDAICQMLDWSTKHTTLNVQSVVWVFNFASAYPGNISTANGYRENATYTNAAIIEYLKTHEAGPTGVILMDYCVDKSGKYNTRGRELVDTLIANNFKWVERVSRATYDQALKNLDKLYEKLANIHESLYESCPDVAQDFEERWLAAKESVDDCKKEVDELYHNNTLEPTYKVDYAGQLRIINKVLSDAKKAQKAFIESGITVVSDLLKIPIARIYTMQGERVSTPIKGHLYLVYYKNGVCRKICF